MLSRSRYVSWLFLAVDIVHEVQISNHHTARNVIKQINYGHVAPDNPGSTRGGRTNIKRNPDTTRATRSTRNRETTTAFVAENTAAHCQATANHIPHLNIMFNLRAPPEHANSHRNKLTNCDLTAALNKTA